MICLKNSTLLKQKEGLKKARHCCARSTTGFTLIEAVIAVAIFALVIAPIYASYTNILLAMQKNEWRQEELAVIQNQMETIRNISYSNIGISGGYPTGLIPSTQTINYLGDNFITTTTVRNVDDPSDGLAPNDTAPADYKLVQITTLCASCGNASPLTITSTFAPHSLETTTNNGSLFINVFNASGLPISQANVHVINNSVSPNISITDTTNVNGQLQLVDIPTSTNGYQISVSKTGYSSSQSYPPGDALNPNPVTPNATVAKGQLTQISFGIDKTSAIDILATNQFCAPVSDVPFLIQGTKLIGSNPDILKYSSTSTTNINGVSQLNNIEWDTYNFNILGNQFALSGNSLPLSLIVNPSSTYSNHWLISPATTSSLLVSVKDNSGALLNGVNITLSKTGYNKNLLTGRRFLSQDDWSPNQYSNKTEGIDTSVTHQVTLASNDGHYPTSTQWLVSNTFDLGVSNTNFYSLSFQVEQPTQTSFMVQLAANNDNATWNFTGPDGTPNTYYSNSPQIVNSALNGNRYLRYKIFMQTNSSSATPTLSKISIDFNSSCIPSGQAFFDNLQTGIYTLTAQKDGYQTYTDPAFNIANGWQQYSLILTSQ